MIWRHPINKFGVVRAESHMVRDGILRPIVGSRSCPSWGSSATILVSVVSMETTLFILASKFTMVFIASNNVFEARTLLDVDIVGRQHVWRICGGAMCASGWLNNAQHGGIVYIVWTNWSHHVASDHRVNWQGPGLDVSADPHRCSDEQRIRLHSYILLDFYCGFRWFQMISFCFCTRTDFQWDLFPNCNEYVT